MRSFALISLLFCSIVCRGQSLPSDDFFQPYKYPKGYTHDGAYRLIELNAHFPRGTAYYGGNILVDVSSSKLGTDAVRLNFGLGIGYNFNKTKQTDFAPTPLFNGTAGENYISDRSEYFNIPLYSRLWIRILDPLNISISGGLLPYIQTDIVNARYTLNDYSTWNEDNHTLSFERKAVSVSATFFYEIKAVYNFKNFGVSAGYAKLGFDDYSMQPVLGFWFTPKMYEPVVN